MTPKRESNYKVGLVLASFTSFIPAEVVHEDIDLRVGRSRDFLIAGNGEVRRERQRTIAFVGLQIIRVCSS